MNALQRATAIILIVVAGPAASAPADGSAAAATRRTPFTHLGANAVLPLRGDGAAATITFGSRADELVTRAIFRFRYSFSPTLLPAASHIKLTLNNEVIGELPMAPEGAGKTAALEVVVDPRLIVGANTLVMSLVAAAGREAGDPTRPGLWAEISGASELEISVQALALADDLAILPEPFFDRRDQRRVTVPFVFAAQPSLATLRAAAVVASWLGQHALWRGARFPVQLDAPAPGHSIAFAANGERPAFLAALPPAAGPQLRIMTNPGDNRSKLLLVLGRDGDDLKAAADALALGEAAMSGPAALVKRVADKAPRAAYEAPRLVRLDRGVKLGELIDLPQQLQASGRPPELDPIRVDVRVPPDLVTWRGPGVPMTLELQYTPPPCTADAYLDLGINDELVQVVALRTANAALTETREILIPPNRVQSRTQLQFGFRFARKDEAGCRDSPAGAVKAAVSPDSTIDFSGFPHYASMPNLGHFASVGFPFTRFADLSQTVVVLPEKPIAADIEAMLGLLGRLGEATGHPATRVRIAAPKDEAALADADLLLIGASPQQVLLDKWAASLPVARDARASPVSFEGAGPLAALYGFESPLTSGRSVVAITAVVPDQLLRVLDALDNREMREEVRGGAAFVFPNKVQSLPAGRTYSVGFLPPWTGAGYWLSEHPVVLGVLAAMTLLGVACATWVLNQKVAAWRERRRA